MAEEVRDALCEPEGPFNPSGDIVRREGLVPIMVTGKQAPEIGWMLEQSLAQNLDQAAIDNRVPWFASSRKPDLVD
jgi:hypothetical protein